MDKAAWVENALNVEMFGYALKHPQSFIGSVEMIFVIKSQGVFLHNLSPLFVSAMKNMLQLCNENAT